MPNRKTANLEDLFTETLKDIYFAEKQNSARSAEDGQGSRFA